MTNFILQTYNSEKFNEVITKARCRIFYKYGNRNGTYITDEFAEKLISTLPYTPVKGIFDKEGRDFTDHGKSRGEGRIYGIVPENPNFAWEEHEDEDGITRTYACVDVFLFTALYAEAAAIAERPESMELYVKTLKGSWQYIEGKRYYVFTEGQFLGLQALGQEVEPCFEGAGFYNLCNSLTDIVKQMETYVLENGGHSEMADSNKLLFKLSDNEKADKIFQLLNPAYNEAGDWQLDYCICDVYDGYAIVYNRAEAYYERAYYTKDDETDSLMIDKMEKCFILDVSESELQALKALQAMNNGTYEKIDEVFEPKKIEYEKTISTLKTESESNEAALNTLQNSIEELNEKISSLTQENEALHTYKTGIEMAEKQAIVDKYAKIIDSVSIAEINDKLSDYTIADLKKDLAELYVEANQSIFSAQPATPQVIPKSADTRSGLEKLLDNYKKD